MTWLARLPGQVSLSPPGSKKVIMLLTDGFLTLPFGQVNTVEPEAPSALPVCAMLARVPKGRCLPLQNPGEVSAPLPRLLLDTLERLSVTNTTTGEAVSELQLEDDGTFVARVALAPGLNHLALEAATAGGAKGAAGINVFCYERP